MEMRLAEVQSEFIRMTYRRRCSSVLDLQRLRLMRDLDSFWMRSSMEYHLTQDLPMALTVWSCSWQNRILSVTSSHSLR